MENQFAIEVSDLKKQFKGKNGVIDAVSDVSFSIKPGERIACIGPNGAGKSTTIKMLTGVLQPTSGSVQVAGLIPSKNRKELTKQIGVLFGQRSQLWSELYVKEGLSLLGSIFGLTKKEIQERIEELAVLLEATDLLDVQVRALSLGQRMRCELAASLIHSPAILFLDEPTIGLDLLAKQRFRELLVKMNEDQGVTIFLTSHDIPDVEAVAQRAIVINHGKVVHDDSVDSLRNSLMATKLIAVHFDQEVQLQLDEVVINQIGTKSFELSIDTNKRQVKDVLDFLLEKGSVADISVEDPPLEDVIARIYGES